MGSGRSKPINYGANCIVIRIANDAFASLCLTFVVGRPLLYKRGNPKARGHLVDVFETARPPIFLGGSFLHAKGELNVQTNDYLLVHNQEAIQ